VTTDKDGVETPTRLGKLTSAASAKVALGTQAVKSNIAGKSRRLHLTTVRAASKFASSVSNSELVQEVRHSKAVKRMKGKIKLANQLRRRERRKRIRERRANRRARREALATREQQQQQHLSTPSRPEAQGAHLAEGQAPKQSASGASVEGRTSSLKPSSTIQGVATADGSSPNHEAAADGTHATGIDHADGRKSSIDSSSAANETGVGQADGDTGSLPTGEPETKADMHETKDELTEDQSNVAEWVRDAPSSSDRGSDSSSGSDSIVPQRMQRLDQEGTEPQDGDESADSVTTPSVASSNTSEVTSNLTAVVEGTEERAGDISPSGEPTADPSVLAEGSSSNESVSDATTPSELDELYESDFIDSFRHRPCVRRGAVVVKFMITTKEAFRKVGGAWHKQLPFHCG